ncbi:MAG TPA: NUDIX domain-containing protein [Dehalococcoidia bacterium]|nr:NUDIX domain-containing protein [Dehalococcoidia bacterium]
MEPDHPSGAAILFVNRRGEFLLQLRDAIPTIRYPNHWGLVGGHAEPGETIEETLVRETLEEVGVSLTDYAFVETCLSVYEGGGMYIHVFSAALDAAAESLPLTEGQRVEYVSPTEALALRLVPWLAELLPRFVASPAYASYVRSPE